MVLYTIRETMHFHKVWDLITGEYCDAREPILAVAEEMLSSSDLFASEKEAVYRYNYVVFCIDLLDFLHNHYGFDGDESYEFIEEYMDMATRVTEAATKAAYDLEFLVVASENGNSAAQSFYFMNLYGADSWEDYYDDDESY